MRTTKIWLIVAFSLVLVGGLIFAGSLSMIQWDFAGLSTTEYIASGYTISDKYSDITIVTDTADVTFTQSKDNHSFVECYEPTNAMHSVYVKDNTLFIELKDNRKWYDNIGFSFDSPQITVSIPSEEYGALNIESSTGSVNIPDDFSFKSIDISASTGNITSNANASEDIKIGTSTGGICVANASARSLDLSVSTGMVSVSDVKCDGDISIDVSTGRTTLTAIKCKNLYSQGSTGSLTMSDVIITDNMSVIRTTGDVKIDSCDANEITIETDTGDISATLLSDKVFITNTDTGSVDVPKTTTGGMCELTTTTGDIAVKIR